jgi:predicted dehydrogenase
MSGGGALLDIGVHVLDLVVWLMGAPKPVSVFGVAVTKFGNRRDVINPDWGPWNVDAFDVDDFAVGLVRFENGAMLTLETAWAANIEDPGRSYILGTDGGCHVVGDKIYEQRNGKLSDTPLHIPKGDSPYYVEVKRFIEAIREGLPSPTPPEEVLRVQQIMNGIYESTETGKLVEIL